MCAAARHDSRPLRSGALPCLLALVPFAAAAAEVDTAKRNEVFEAKPVAQERVGKSRIEVGPARPAAGSRQRFVTVPAADAKFRLRQDRSKEKAPIDMTARTMPLRETATASISTAQPAPAKFGKKFAAPTVSWIQEGMTEAGRVKTATVKAKARGNMLERINRFVFRRNPAEPGPEIAPAGGANPPVEDAPADIESAGS